MNIDEFTFKQKQSLVPVCYIIVMKIAVSQQYIDHITFTESRFRFDIY